MLSIIIPSRNELFLNNTIRDVLKNATGEIEVFPILDGYEPPELVEDKRVHYIRLPKQSFTQKRHGINKAVSLAKGKYIMALDAHCMVAKGFDEVLAKDCEDDWVVIPRRHRLDAENWCLQKQGHNKPPIDYEYTMLPRPETRYGLHGYKWNQRTLERWDIKIDDTLTCQGSCWFMTKKHYQKMGFMKIEGYTGWGQEAEEICFTTWLMGGRVIVNKNTWYAHLHKGKKYGRMYFMSKKANRACNDYSYEFWMNNKLKNRVHDLDWLIEKFMPLPKWPANWKEILNYGNVKLSQD